MTRDYVYGIINRAEAEGWIELNLSMEDLRELPKEIGRLSNLQTLDISYNELRTLPEWLGQMINLQSLNISYNRLGTLPEWLGKMTNLQSLEISGNNLGTLPDWLSQMTNLHSLNLSWNNLVNLPEWLPELTNLQSLNLAANNLFTLPEWLPELTNLQSLDLYSTKLGMLPEWLPKLTNLQSLNIGSNHLSTLPELLTRLTNLQILSIAANNLGMLPEWFGQMTNLQSLNIYKNNLGTLPIWLRELTNLQILSIAANNLGMLPEWLVQLPNLQSLYIFDNPITEPSPEVLGEALTENKSADMDAIRRYYAQLREEGQAVFYEAKLLIIGEGGVGKTSLARKLRAPDQPLQAEEESTAGIDIIRWHFDLPNGYEKAQYQVNVWDFGGQAVYFATHQFFLTKRSVYVLVTDTRKAHTDFYDWLRMQEAFGKDSPVILLKNLNRKEGNRFYIENLPQIQDRFPNLKEIFEVDLSKVPDDRQWERLVETLQDYFLGLGHVGQPRPKTWVKVRETLKTDDRDIITIKAFLELCFGQGVKQEEDALQLSDYLHHLGDILHFQDDPVLNKVVILNPTWGLDAVYQVLDNPMIVENWGQFTLGELDGLWEEDKYEGHQHQLLRLMQNFQLCYPVPGQQDVYIAPQLLSPDVPEYEWDETNNLKFRYKYKGFFPRGILSRMIVKLHDKIEDQPLVWRSGVILKGEYARAEVLELRVEDEIRVRISGRLKRELLTEIVAALDELHQGFSKLRYEKLVPCKCSRCVERKEPHFFDLDLLRLMLSYGVPSIQCLKPNFEMVPIMSLIDDGFVVDRRGISREERIQYFIEGDYIADGDKFSDIRLKKNRGAAISFGREGEARMEKGKNDGG